MQTQKYLASPNLQSTFVNIHEWLKTKKNWFKSKKKSQVLKINKSKPFPVNCFINKTRIPTVKFLKDLEIYISENIIWNEHVNYLYKIAQNSFYQKLKCFITSTASILLNYLKSMFALNLV